MLPQELNLKAFLKNTREMVKVININFITEKITYCKNIFDDSEQVACYKEFEADFKDVELIQCTNLKDSKGNYIYEGDIVKTLESLTGIVKYEKHKGDAKNLYHFGWYIEWFGKNNKMMFSNQILPFVESKTNSSCFEIIGNIFQNPELVEFD